MPSYFRGRQFDICRDDPDEYRDDLLVPNQNFLKQNCLPILKEGNLIICRDGTNEDRDDIMEPNQNFLKQKCLPILEEGNLIICRDGKIRTCDLLVPNQAR